MWHLCLYTSAPLPALLDRFSLHHSLFLLLRAETLLRQLLPVERRDANKFTLSSINLLIFSPNFLAKAGKNPLKFHLSDINISNANRFFVSSPLVFQHVLPRLSRLSVSGTDLLLFVSSISQTEEEVSVGGHCQPRFLPDSVASLTPQQGRSPCCQGNRGPWRAG